MVLVLLVSPLVDGSELPGLGDALPGAIPGGVLVIGDMVLDELDGVEDVSVVEDEEEGLIDDEDADVEGLPVVVPPELEGMVVVLDVVELVSVLGVAGG